MHYFHICIGYEEIQTPITKDPTENNFHLNFVHTTWATDVVRDCAHR